MAWHGQSKTNNSVSPSHAHKKKKTKLRDRGQLYIVRSRAGILPEGPPPSGCSNDPRLVYLDRTAAAVSKKAWYDLMASGADIVANQSVLSPWTFGTASKTALILAGGADAISFAMATVTASWLAKGVTSLPSTALKASK